MKFRRHKRQELYKELQPGDLGLTVNEVMTDEQVQKFTNTIEWGKDDRRGDFKP